MANALDQSETKAAASRPAWTAALACLLLSLVFILHLLVLPFGRDQAIFAVVADTMLAGGAPYKDAWDFKPPGIFFVYAFAQLFFGPAETGLRIVEAATLCLGLWAAYRISAEAVDRRAVFFIAPVFLFGITQYGFWHVGQPEVFGAALILLAIYLSSIPRALWAVAALYVCAALLKPPLGGGILISYAFALYAVAKANGGWRGAAGVTLQFALGAAAILGALFLYLAAAGAFDDFYWTLFVFTPNYTGVGNVSYQLASLAGLFFHGLKKLVANWPVLSVGVLLFTGLGLRGRRAAKWSLHLILVAGMTLLGVALQAKFFPYHYAATVGLCAVLAGWGYWALYVRISHWPLGGLLALCAMVVPMFLGRPSLRYWQNGAALASVAFALPQEKAAVTDKLYSTGNMDRRSNLDAVAWARKHVPEDETIYIWGFEPVIYLQSGRRPASRFIYNVAQRAEWSAGMARAELMRSLEANAPFAIFVQSDDIMPAVTGSGLDSRQTLDREFPELRALLGSGYTYAADTGRFRIYQRKP